MKTDDAIWTVEDSSRIVFTFEKVNNMEWWKCVCKGDPEINTRKVPRAAPPPPAPCTPSSGARLSARAWRALCAAASSAQP